MMKPVRIVHGASALAIVLLASAVDAQAQIRRVEPSNSIGFNIGYFAVRAEDSRVTTTTCCSRICRRSRSRSTTSTARASVASSSSGSASTWKAGVGVNYYQRTVPSVYRDVVSDDGFEIAQELKLRVIPISATIRFLPIGRGGVEPYVGAGIGIFPWRYSEVGEFVDFSDDSHLSVIGMSRMVRRSVPSCSAAFASRLPTSGRSAAKSAGRRRLGTTCSSQVCSATRSISAAGLPASRSICASERIPFGVEGGARPPSMLPNPHRLPPRLGRMLDQPPGDAPLPQTSSGSTVPRLHVRSVRSQPPFVIFVFAKARARGQAIRRFWRGSRTSRRRRLPESSALPSGSSAYFPQRAR